MRTIALRAHRFHQRSLFGAVMVVAGALLFVGSSRAQSIDTTLWVTNGSVNGVARVGNTLYIGGSFTMVGPATGGGVPLGEASGAVVPPFPKVTGTVYAVIPDGSGGWYIGGDFQTVGGLPLSYLARILADGSVGAWNPASNGAVTALALSGGTVYAGGNFTNIGGQARNQIAALDATTAAATAWNPNANGNVSALVVSGVTVYAGGTFSNIGGQARNNVAALDASGGGATTWNPNANAGVAALAVSGTTVYAGGSFTSIGGQTRNRIAALDAATANATTWNPNANGIVAAMVVAGSTVYAAGSFTNIGGQARSYVAALDATGAATAWNPNANGAVRTLVMNGSTFYAGGDFTAIGGQVRNYVAALDAAGIATAWNPNASPSVFALAVSGSTVYAGGSFTTVGGQARNRIAALDAIGGGVTGWNPNSNGTILALAVSGNTVYLGGFFTGVDAQTRHYIAAVDATTGFAKPWNPDADSNVRTLAVSGSTVYAGGDFTNIGGQSRNRIAALDAATATARAWNPNAGGPVWALAVSGTKVYTGGEFTTIGGAARNRIAALDSASGNATAWNPNADGIVRAIAPNGNTIYAGGQFNFIGGQPRDYLAAVDAVSGAATAWNPSASSNVNALALSGGTVYAGGDFYNIGGQERNGIAALSAVNATATVWNPSVNGSVSVIAVSEATVYAGGFFASVGNRPQSHLVGIARAPEMAQIEPDHGGDDGSVTVTVAGSAFRSGASVKLLRSGQVPIAGSSITVAADGQSLSAIFDLTGAVPGAWDVVVTHPDLQTATLAGAFAVELGASHQLRVDVIGPALIRPNRRVAFDVVLENLGNSDVLSVPLWIARIPVGATVELDFALAAPPQAGGEPDWSQAPLTFTGPGGRYLALVIPRLPPGTSVRRLYLTVPNTVTSFEMNAALTPPWVDGAVFRGCLSGAGVITSPLCMGTQLTAINAYLAATPGLSALSGIGLWAKIAWQCEGAGSLAAALAKAEQVLDFMLQPIEGASIPAGCQVTLEPRWQDRHLVTIVTSVDPNDKLGVTGVGASHLIGNEQILPYSIRFENAPTASAPAQEVVVIDAIDAATLDLNTVSLGRITFGNRVIEPPPGLSSYTTQIDLRPQQQLIVRVGASLDHATGVLAWSMTSIDPATGQSPANPLVGFLPPNVTPPQGEGSVLFTVMPKPGLGGGTSIRNRATIDFDGDSRQTPEWSNTLDITPPESAVLPLGATQDSTSFTVRWGANGAPPDLRDFSVYVSEHGGAFRPWRVNVRTTADTITAPRGGSFAFYSLARDSSGNLEAVPSTPDVQTYSLVSVVETGGARLALEGAVPNPVRGRARVWFTLPSRERAMLEVMDIAGRRVWRREVGTLGPGRHSVELGTAARRPGLYFLRLAQGGQVLRARMAVIR